MINNYQQILNDLKDKIRQARYKASHSVNRQMLEVYSEIGRIISEEEKSEGWGAKIVENLSRDLKMEFKDMRAFSPRNLRYMRDFAVAYPNFPNLQADLAKSYESTNQPILQVDLAKLTWFHHITLLQKVKEPERRLFYMQKTIENGWTRDSMVHQIDAGLDRRIGRLTQNFKETIDPAQSELVQQIFKDPYKFDFIQLGEKAKERDLEEALTSHITNFLLELGQWFSFMGRQYKILLGEKEYFFDLLFYHTRLKRYIVIDLKIGEFKPEYVGKMKFYLTLSDEQLADKSDEKSIGLILCKTKDGLVAEYALRDSQNPIGISEYAVFENLPENIKGELPTIEEIEQTVGEEIKEFKTPSEKRLDKLREKIAGLKGEEITTPATFQLLTSLFVNSFKPLYETLIFRLKEFDPEFISSSFGWSARNTSLNTLNELEIKWQEEEFLRQNMDFQFWYRLSGLKKAGVAGTDIVVTFIFKMDTYFYGFKLINYNDQQPFIKKPYDQHLTKSEISQICEIVCGQVIDRIELQLGFGN